MKCRAAAAALLAGALAGLPAVRAGEASSVTQPAPTTVAPQTPVPLPEGLEALVSPAEARGLYDEAAREWLRIAAAAPSGLGAELALRRLAAARPMLAALRPLTADLEKLADNRAASPAVNFLARRLLLDCLREAGRWKEAARLAGELGFVADWLAIGSFGRDIPAMHDRVFGPETNQDPAAAHDSGRSGVRSRLSWRPLPRTAPGEPLAPLGYLQPAGGAFYLLAQLRSEAAVDAVLTVTCRSSFKVWLNGALLADADRGRLALPEELTSSVRLAAGWNRLLIKVTGRAPIAVRLAGGDGRPLVLPGEARAVLHPAAPAPTSASAPVPAPVSGPAEIPAPAPAPAAEGTAPERRGALPAAARGYLLQLQGMDEEAVALLREAAEADPGRAAWRFLLGEACRAAGHLPAPTRRNLAAEAYRECLRLHPGFVPALLRLAEQEAEDGDHRRALELLDAACRAGGGSHLPWLRRAGLAMELGWRSQARAWLSEAQKLRPDYPGCRLLEARLQREAGVLDRSVTELRELLAADASSREARSLLARAMGDRGLWRDAVKLCRETAAVWPTDPEAHLELAGVLESSGSFPEAAAALESAIALVPGAAQYHLRLGEVLAKAGDRKRSLEAYAASLELDPGQHRLRRLVERLSGVGEDFSAPYALDMMKELAESGKYEYAGADAVRVLDQTVVRVQSDASVSQIVANGEKILTPAAVSRLGNQPVLGEMMEARTIRRDGSALEPTPIPGQLLTMPGLEPGAAVEYRYRIDEPSTPGSGFYLGKWYFRSPQLDLPHQVSDYVVMVPSGLPHRVVRHNFDVPERVEEKDGMTVYRWTARNQPQVYAEQHMPHFDLLLPFVEVGTERSWQDVADTFRSACLFRARATRLVSETASRACAGRSGAREKAAGIYELLNTAVRGRGPHLVAHQSLVAGSGDRELVFLALAEAAGLQSCLGLTRAAPERQDRRQAPATWSLPSEDHFTARLVGVRLEGGQLLWLDLASRFMPFGCLRPELGGARVLAVPMRGPAFFDRLPAASPADEAEGTELELRLDANGRLTGAAAISGRGAAAAARRERIEPLDERGRREAVEKDLAALLPGAAVLEASCEALPGSGGHLTRATIEADGQLVPVPGGRLALRAAPAPLGLLSALAMDPVRRHPLKLASPLLVQQTVLCHLAQGLETAELPPPVTLAGTFGSYSLSWTTVPGGFRLERRLVVPVQSISTEAYQDFRAFCRDVDEAERAGILLRRTGG